YHFHQIAGRMTITNKPGQYFDAINSIEQLNGTSIQYYSHLFRLKILLGVQQGDYPAVSQQCKKALQFFAGRKGVHSSTFQFLHLKKGISHMVQSDYRKAGRSFSQAAKLAPVKSVNDYISRLYLALNAIHAKNYTEAYEIYRANRKCKFAPIREQFTIIEAYMCFLAHEGYLQLDRRFRIGKYLNETFQAQANKQGDNINILIAELLVYYARDREKFIDRVDAVKRYSYQYLKTTETQRAKHFMKILCLLPKANFHIPTLRRLAKRHIDWLDDHPLHVGNNFAIEIIPFDDLLKMILGKAERKMAT
ncbi:MAG: tetratricopeptide repeat protein, partial [Bacteroidota bacterium]